MKPTRLAVAPLLMTLVACGSTSDSLTTPSLASSPALVETLLVAPARVACTGVAAQSCLQVRETADQPWRTFHGEIVGFAHEPGFLYELRVETRTVEHPPADASALRLTLLAVISKTPAVESPVGPTWQLVTMHGEGLRASASIDATFDGEGRVGGSAGCNRYFGKAVVSETGRLRVGPLASTLMHCGDELMPQERSFLLAFDEADAYRVAARQLIVSTAGKDTLVFERR